MKFNIILSFFPFDLLLICFLNKCPLSRNKIIDENKYKLKNLHCYFIRRPKLDFFIYIYILRETKEEFFKWPKKLCNINKNKIKFLHTLWYDNATWRFKNDYLLCHTSREDLTTAS